MNKVVNIANLLSLLRIILTPVCIILLLPPFYLYKTITALIVFTIAALTDSYDGYFARKFKVESEFGNFLDPIADKILLISTFVTFWILKLLPLWFVGLLVFRDVIVTKLRAVCLHNGTPLKTTLLGKSKTFLQFAIIYLLFGFILLQYSSCSDVVIDLVARVVTRVIYIVAVLTLYSGLHYCWVSLKVLYPPVQKFVKKNQWILNKITEFLATVLYIGYCNFFPGTLASLVTCLVLFILPTMTFTTHMVSLISIFLIGVVTANWYEQQYNKKDPSCIVIDEVAGMLLALIFVPQQALWYGLSLLFFRFFDIIKPFPISSVEKHIPGGLGVMVDDILAGAGALICVHLLLFFS